MNQHFIFHRLLWLHKLQIVSVCFEVGPTAATADHTLQVQFTNKPNHSGFTKHFGGPNFHILEFVKTLAHDIKIQYKFMYGQTNCFHMLSVATAGRACSHTTELSQGRHFGGPNFHLVEFAKTLAHNVKIQSKCIYGFILYYSITDLVLFNC